jgi:hypothetical protein
MRAKIAEKEEETEEGREGGRNEKFSWNVNHTI